MGNKSITPSSATLTGSQNESEVSRTMKRRANNTRQNCHSVNKERREKEESRRPRQIQIAEWKCSAWVKFLHFFFLFLLFPYDGCQCVKWQSGPTSNAKRSYILDGQTIYIAFCYISFFWAATRELSWITLKQKSLNGCDFNRRVGLHMSGYFKQSDGL